MKIRVSINLFIVAAMDISILWLAFYLANLIRFEFAIPVWAKNNYYTIFFIALAVKLSCFYFFDLYKGMWRYTGLSDLVNVVKANFLATCVIVTVILYKNRFEMASRSVFFIDWCLSVMGIMGIRIATRLCFEEFTEDFKLTDVCHAITKIIIRPKRKGRSIIIIGAGDCGEKICREFIENPGVKSHVVGFLDDDPSKMGRKIHGIPVLGEINTLEGFSSFFNARDVIIAIPSVTSKRMQDIVGVCKRAGVNFKTVPNMGELIDGKITLNSIRKVEYQDLLGREPVYLDRKKIGNYLGHKKVLVTGAGGSIGAGLCRQICQYKPQTLILFDRAESPLYEIDLELRKTFPNVQIIQILGDIQNEPDLLSAFEKTVPDIIFHAAAYKHVPMLENSPWKAVENNILGTQNLIKVSQKFNCGCFVLVSTDKAVNPTSVMGVSKRVAELLVQLASRNGLSDTRFMTVRFGNVIGSVGSVIPLFQKQIQEGGPVTVTHPGMTRYFMLIPEACQLILQSATMGKGGEIFILKMGEPVSIDGMARELIRFSGFEPGNDIDIIYTGLRPGEKLSEELIAGQENLVSTNHEKIMVLNNNWPDQQNMAHCLFELEKAATSKDITKIKEELNKIVPEYQ